MNNNNNSIYNQSYEYNNLAKKTDFCISTYYEDFIYKWNFSTSSFHRIPIEKKPLEISEKTLTSTSDNYDPFTHENSLETSVTEKENRIRENDLDDESILFNIRNNLDIDPIVFDNYLNKIINLSPYKKRFPLDVFFGRDKSLYYFESYEDYPKILCAHFLKLLTKQSSSITENDKEDFKFHNHILRYLILRTDEKLVESIPIDSLATIVPFSQWNNSLAESVEDVIRYTAQPLDTFNDREKSALLLSTFALTSLKKKHDNYDPFRYQKSLDTSIPEKENNIDVNTLPLGQFQIDSDLVLLKIKNGIKVHPKVLDSYVDYLISLSPYKETFSINVFMDSDSCKDSMFYYINFPSILNAQLSITFQKDPSLVNEDEKGSVLFYLHLLRRIVLNDRDGLKSLPDEYIPIRSLTFIVDEYNYNYSKIPLYNILVDFVDLVTRPFDLSIKSVSLLMLTYDLINKRDAGLLQ